MLCVKGCVVGIAVLVIEVVGLRVGIEEGRVLGMEERELVILRDLV